MIDINTIQPGTMIKVTKFANPNIGIGDILEVEKIEISSFKKIYVKKNGKSLGWLSPDFFEPIDAPIQNHFCRCVMIPIDKPEFKLGKYKHKYLGIMEVIATHKNKAWCEMDGGIMVMADVDSLLPLAKFDHLRGLAKDKEVIVWDNPDRKKARRHFSHVSDDGNLVYCFVDGKTSFTSDTKPSCGFAVNGWDNCEVWEEK